MRRRADGGRELEVDAPLWRVLSERPNIWQTPFEFFTLMQRNLLLRGNAYARIVRNGARVTDLVPLHPDDVEPEQLPDNSLRYIYTPARRANGAASARGGKRVLAQRDVLHLRHRPRPGEILGVSVIEHARESLGMAIQTERHGASVFRNGARPSGVLQTDQILSKEAQQALREQIDAHRGSDNANRTMVLEQGLKFEAVTMNQADAQFIETRQFTRAEIATFFGVPPHMIGDTERATSWGAGIEQQTIGFITYTLRPWLTLWEQSLGRALLEDQAGLIARFDVGDLLRGDAKAEAEFFAKALQWGWMSPNEVRARQGLNPRDGGEAFYPPPNMTQPAEDNAPPPTSDAPETGARRLELVQ